MNHDSTPASLVREGISEYSLTSDQFKISQATAARHFSLLRNKYPALKAYLVMSLPGGQCNLGSDPLEMLKEFPNVLMDGGEKTRMLDLLKIPQSNDASAAEKERWQKQFQRLAEDLRYDGNTRLELRFKDLDYDLVWKLQNDDMVNRDLTPRTKASIRIVLGTIHHFAGCRL